MFNKQFSQVYQRLRFIFQINNLNNKCKHLMCPSEIKNASQSSHVTKFGRKKNEVFFPDFPVLNPNSIKSAPSRGESVLCSPKPKITVILIKASVRRTSSRKIRGSFIAYAGLQRSPQEPQSHRLSSFGCTITPSSTQNFLGEHVEFEKKQAFFLRKLFSSPSFFTAPFAASAASQETSGSGNKKKSSSFSFCTSSIDAGEVKVFPNSLQRWFGIKNRIVIGAGVKLIRYSFPFEKCIMKNHVPGYTIWNQTKSLANDERKKQNWDSVEFFHPPANFVGLLNQKNEKKARAERASLNKGKCKCYQTSNCDPSKRGSTKVICGIKRQRYSLSKFQLVGYAVQALLTCLDQTNQQCEFNFGSGRKNEAFSSARDLIRGVFIVWPFNCFAQKPFFPPVSTLNNGSIGLLPESQKQGEEKVVFSSTAYLALKDNDYIHKYKIPRIIFISPNEFKQCIVSFKAGYGTLIESLPIILIRDLTHIKQQSMRIKNVMVYLYLITQLNHVTTRLAKIRPHTY